MSPPSTNNPLHRFGQLLTIYTFRKALFPHLGAFEIAILISLFKLYYVLGVSEKNKYLDFRRDIFTDDEIQEVEELSRHNRHVILLGNALPILKARVLRPLQEYPQPLHLWMVCRTVGPADQVVLPSYVGGTWGISLPSENSELPWSESGGVWDTETNSTDASWSRSYGLKSNWHCAGVKVHGLVSWRTLYTARVDRIVWMDCHSSHDLLNYADFEDPSLDPLWSECSSCRNDILSAFGNEIGVLAEASAPQGPLFSSNSLADPSILYYLEMSTGNRKLKVSRTGQRSTDDSQTDDSHVFEICLYTSCAPNHIAWYNHEQARFVIRFGDVNHVAKLNIS